jgi:hypothetical protein
MRAGTIGILNNSSEFHDMNYLDLLNKLFFVVGRFY